jgi:hypothetical protein
MTLANGLGCVLAVCFMQEAEERAAQRAVKKAYIRVSFLLFSRNDLHRCGNLFKDVCICAYRVITPTVMQASASG